MLSLVSLENTKLMNLFKALSYKEWIKTRKIIGVLLLVALAVIAYAFIEVTHLIRLNDANKVWFNFLFLDVSLPSATAFFPLLTGIALALVQFVPEMVSKRLKLTLHLPAEEFSIVTAMLLYGYLVLAVIFLLSIALYVIGFSFIFSSELIQMTLSKLIPTFVSGLVAYGLTAWICFEPQWKQRILNILITFGLLSVFFISQQWGVYLHFNIGQLVLLLASFAFPFYSVMRFKHGVL